MDNLINKTLTPVTIFTVEDTDMPDLIPEDELKRALLANGTTISRSGHLFQAHEKWNLSNPDGSVKTEKLYIECLHAVLEEKSDTICLIDLDLGDTVNGAYANFFETTQLGPVAAANPRDRAGLAFAFEILSKFGRINDPFLTVVFCSVTLTEYAVLEELRNHPSWSSWSSRINYAMSFPRQCKTSDSVSQNISQAIDKFLDAKGYGIDAKERIRKESKEWFPIYQEELK